MKLKTISSEVKKKTNNPGTKVSTENGNVFFRYFEQETMFSVGCILARICFEQRCVQCRICTQFHWSKQISLHFPDALKYSKWSSASSKMDIVLRVQLIAYRINASCLQDIAPLIISKHVLRNNTQIEKRERHFKCCSVDDVFLFRSY